LKKEWGQKERKKGAQQRSPHVTRWSYCVTTRSMMKQLIVLTLNGLWLTIGALLMREKHKNKKGESVVSKMLNN